MWFSSNLVKFNKLKIVPTVVGRGHRIDAPRTAAEDTHQAGGERRCRLAQGLAAHAHEVGRLRRGWPGLPGYRVWKEVPPCWGEREDRVSGRQNITISVSTTGAFLAILLYCFCHSPYIYSSEPEEYCFN